MTAQPHPDDLAEQKRTIRTLHVQHRPAPGSSLAPGEEPMPAPVADVSDLLAGARRALAEGIVVEELPTAPTGEWETFRRAIGPCSVCGEPCRSFDPDGRMLPLELRGAGVTCIVGLETEEGVLLGADSWSDNGWSGGRRADEKLFAVGHYVIGFTTSYRMGQLLRYRLRLVPGLDVHRASDADLLAFMATDFIDIIRVIFKDGGWGERDKEREKGGAFLVAVGGRLFGVEDDHQVMRSAEGYQAVGSGYQLALGSFATSEPLGWEPAKRVSAALAAADRHCGGVNGPFLLHLQNRAEAPA